MSNKKAIETFFNRGYTINNKGQIFNPRGKEVKGTIHVLSKGYNRKELTVRDRHLTYNISFHRIQGYKKFGDRIFEDGIQVRHLNNDSLDNSWDNIDIGDNSDNRMDLSDEVRLTASIIATRKMQNNRRTYEERCVIYMKLHKGLTYREIMSEHKISQSTLSSMKNRSKEYRDYISASIA